MTREEVIAQIDERCRAEARAKTCKSRVSREPIPGKQDAFNVRVNGRHVGLLRRIGNAKWSSVYLENGADLHLGIWHGKAIALDILKRHVVREEERRVAAEIVLADTLAHDFYPRVLVAGVLSQIRANMLAGHIGPTVATMHAVHVLTHLTGVDASR